MTETATRRYSFKLYPNAGQREAIERQCVLLARLWNAALEQRETQWAHECQSKARAERKGLSRFDQQRDVKFIRRDDPEYAAMSSSSLHLCLKALDLAFQSFFRRARGGAGASSGYPKYKSAARHRTIWHRDGAGWKLHSAGKNFKIYAKGIPGMIRARGKFPAEPVEIRTMEIIERDGAWFASIVVFMKPRRTAGKHKLEIDFDLIDEFARIKNRANGRCPPGLAVDITSINGQRSPQLQRDDVGSGTATPEMGTSGRSLVSSANGSATPELRAPDRNTTNPSAGTPAPEMRAHDRDSPDSITSEGDRRYKRGSYRWKKARKRAAKHKAREARRRRESLHKWTTKVIDASADLLVIAPPIKETTKTGRGNEKRHGASVQTVALINRHVLEQAPATAIAMLTYKAEEAGVTMEVIDQPEPKIAIGHDLAQTVRTERKTRRALKG